MPSYGSLGSPSLKNMDYNNARYGGGRKFNSGLIFGDPFPLATIGIAVVSLKSSAVRAAVRIECAHQHTRMENAS